MMVLDSYQEAPNPGPWETWTVGTSTDYISFDGYTSGGGEITDDFLFLTLTFRCLSQGSSLVTLDIGFLRIAGQTVNPPDFVLTCNQLSRATSNPYHYVGGELFTANKLAVLSPYLALIGLAGVVASAAVVTKKRRRE